jgi:hypothetical protein
MHMRTSNNMSWQFFTEIVVYARQGTRPSIGEAWRWRGLRKDAVDGGRNGSCYHSLPKNQT